MRAEIRVVKPNTIDVAITLVAPLEEWKKLREQLRTDWPSLTLRSVIDQAVTKLERQAESTDEVQP